MARPRSRDLDARILDATLSLMARQGYARMSIEAVAAEAGVSRPTVYLRYESKEGLAVAALGAFRERDRPRLSGDVRADLVAQLRHFRRGVERPYGMAMVGTVLAEEPHTPELLERFREGVVRPRRNELRGILDGARERGELRSDADLDSAVSMLIGSFYAARIAGRRPAPSWPAAEVDAVLRGLAPAGR
jgi:AcrR family transcriptional regulator